MTALPKFSSRAFLAPMAGVSDPALRLLCKKMGAGLVVTELTSIHAIVAKEHEFTCLGKDITNFLEFSENERPLSVQLFGSDLLALNKSAQIIEPFFDVIDYNMGCPAPHITKQMAGAALLQNSTLTRKIFRTLVESVEKPVTVKMRTGLSENLSSFREIAQIAQDEGIQMITLHPRTVSQGFSGHSNWDFIRELKELVDVPVVGNGDILTPEDAKQMIDYTGCDYVMIGRAAMGNPYLFEQINDFLHTGKYNQYDLSHKLDVFLQYLEIALNYKIKFSNIRQQALHFTKGHAGSKKLRLKLMSAKTNSDIKSILQNSLCVA